MSNPMYKDNSFCFVSGEQDSIVPNTQTMALSALKLSDIQDFAVHQTVECLEYPLPDRAIQSLEIS